MSERSAIQDQISRYTDAVNRRDWAAFPDIFAPAAVWEAPAIGVRLEGLEAITRGLSEIVDAMSMFVQLNAPAVIDMAGDRASARSPIHELGETPADGMRFEVFGRYEDVLVRVDGRWLFESRTFLRAARTARPIEK